MRQLDAQHYSSRMMPSQMMNQGLQGLGMLGSQAYGQTNNGMDQFYANQNRAFSPSYFGTFANALTSGYGTANQNVGGLAGNLNSAWGDNKSQYGSATGDLLKMYNDMNGTPAPAQKTLAQQRAEASGNDFLQGLHSAYSAPWQRGGLTPQQQKTYSRNGYIS